MLKVLSRLELGAARLNEGVVDFAVRLGRWIMAGVHSARATIRFGGFEADFRAGELRKRGVKVKLQEQPLEVLMSLLEKPSEVVSREELNRGNYVIKAIGYVLDSDCEPN